MKTVEGNLIDLCEAGVFDAMIHGCNCFTAMGRGIAGEIHKRYPEAYDADLKTIRGDRNKLGTFTYCTINHPDHAFRIVNAYTQFMYGADKDVVYAEYSAIREVFMRIKTTFGNRGMKFGIPLIGAGLANGDWSIIKGIIETEMIDEDITLVLLPK